MPFRRDTRSRRTDRTPRHGRATQWQVREQSRNAQRVGLGGAAAEARCRSVAVRVTPLSRRRRARVRSDASSTRYKISSNRSNDRTRMCGLGRLARDGVMSPEWLDQRRIPADEESSASSRYYLGAGTVQNGCCVATNSIRTPLTKVFNQFAQSSIPACSEGTCPIRISAFFLP